MSNNIENLNGQKKNYTQQSLCSGMAEHEGQRDNFEIKQR